jgi:ribonuclease Z
LGSSSATPTKDRHPSAQVLKIGSEKILIDCGEGTQSQLMKFGIKQANLNTICISHLHGDHYFGLIGLLSTMSLYGRTQAMTIIGPPMLKDIIDIQLTASGMALNFELIHIETTMDKHHTVYQTAAFSIQSFPLQHRIHCTGFLIQESPKERHLNTAAIEQYQIPVAAYKAIKAGQDYNGPDGQTIPNAVLTTAAASPCSYAYCSDTIFDPQIVPFIQGAHTLYHEATYTNEHADRAELYFHSTAEGAATIAQMAEVKQLIIGHYSSRYSDISDLQTEAATLFENVTAVEDGMIIKIV